MGKKLKILLTNDDGVNSMSTFKLADNLREKGHKVVTVVPLDNKSGISSAVSLMGNLVFSNIKKDTYSVTGTPCDCINLVIGGGILENEFDLVISGINKGENAGLTIHDSGTIAAARRAKIFGYNSIAVSYANHKTTPHEMEKCNRYFLELLENNNYYLDQCRDEYININIPLILKDTNFDIVRTKPGKGNYKLIFKEVRKGVFRYDELGEIDKSTFEDGCDHDVISKGKVSISYLNIYNR